MSECSHNCETCGENCESRIEKVKPAEGSSIKHIISVVSGKGGVGKSLVTSLLASRLAKLGYKVGILDADITGPSIPASFKVATGATSSNNLINPSLTNSGIKIVSAGLMLDDNEEPIIWRGPMISSLVKQLFTDVRWEQLDYLLIDMPPGTSDVALTIWQLIPVEGAVIVTSPQSLVSTIVAKAINMANQMSIKVFGVVENMSFVECKKCGEKNYVFGKSHAKEICDKYGVELLGSLPLSENIAEAIDNGNVEDIDLEQINTIVDNLIK